MLITRAMGNASDAMPQSRAKLVSSVFCMVSDALALELPAVPILEYWLKIDVSSLLAEDKMSNTSFSHIGKPKTCARSIFFQIVRKRLSPFVGGEKRFAGGATISEMTACSSFSPRKLAMMPSTRCAKLISSISSYLMWPHNPKHTTNSSNIIVVEPSSAPADWHVTNAPLASSHDKLEWRFGSGWPCTIGVGSTVISLVTLRSNSSSQNFSMLIISDSSPPAVMFESAFAAATNAFCRAARRGRSTSCTSGSFSTIFLTLAS
mmetsp:Transcript_24932/g.50078  ORF Transcript_24932/g.50078 Transcript_24932/m.50078 type:complete len:263 (+) Transcript_24932:1122-1910(+)